jgi:NAD(P)-dependent dehydrogenase (short-subunit alcohol dehydrogenase family)
LSRVFITGSSDGLGLMAGQLLAGDGHSVTLHARNASRADDTRAVAGELLDYCAELSGVELPR